MKYPGSWGLHNTLAEGGVRNCASGDLFAVQSMTDSSEDILPDERYCPMHFQKSASNVESDRWGDTDNGLGLSKHALAPKGLNRGYWDQTFLFDTGKS